MITLKNDSSLEHFKIWKILVEFLHKKNKDVQNRDFHDLYNQNQSLNELKIVNSF